MISNFAGCATPSVNARTTSSGSAILRRAAGGALTGRATGGAAGAPPLLFRTPSAAPMVREELRLLTLPSLPLILGCEGMAVPALSGSFYQKQAKFMILFLASFSNRLRDVQVSA